jgi:hypothetical protein
MLDVGISLESDSTEFLNLFDRDYCWFRTPSVDGKRSLVVSLQLKQEEHFVCINDKVFSLKNHPNQIAFAYQLLLRAFFEEIRDFMLLHAGVAAKDGQALILAGPPGAGKTTLLLKLLEMGFTFSSDDICPIHKQTKLVHPFPRTLWVSNQLRPAIPESQPATPNQLGGTLRKKKSPVTTYELRSPVAAKPCRGKCLISLDPDGGDPDPFCELEIELKESGNELLTDLQQLELKTLDPKSSIQNRQRIIIEKLNNGFSQWRVRYPVGQGLSRKIKGLLRNHQEHIWNAYRIDAIRPDFTREPILTPIASHEAVFHLLRGLKQDLSFQEKTGASEDSPGRFFMTLHGLLEGVSCYRLSVGRLEAMRDLLLEAAG